MGAGLSDEDDAGQERAPCNERYLHWLLSDPSRVQEAFKPVWRACSTDEQGIAPKSVVLEVMLRVVAEFERNTETGSKASAAGKTPRQLARVVTMLPEKLTRTEALHLFRTALLSVQASLVTTLGQGSMLDWPQSPYGGGSPVSDGMGGPLSNVGGDAAGYGAGGLQPGGVSPSPDGRYYGAAGLPAGGFGAMGTAMAAGGAELAPASRASTRAEDHTPKLRIMRLHPAVKSAQLTQPGILPSREELDGENHLLRELSEVVEASARDELAVVRSLEEEVRANEVCGDVRNRRRGAGAGGRDDALFQALEAKADATGEEVRQLEVKVKTGDRELSECEAEVLAQQREIQALLARRGEEEASADERNREARDLTLELKSCRRTCGSLESEIASEEARAAALRQAFEGRRARFTTAETAARNAELSTMRATRRRIAAEAAARREATAVEEAEHAREFAITNSEMKVEEVVAEIEELKAQGPRSQAASSSLASAPGGRRSLTAQATVGAEAAVAALRSELQQAETERDDEVAAAHSSANEVAELEVARARLEGQLAGRESELHAVQRRALRTSSASAAGTSPGGPAAPAEEDDREVRSMMANLQAIEMRVAGAKQHELEMCSELRGMAAARSSEAGKVNGGDLADEELLVEEAWRRAREVGAELGEAHAALARRRAQDQSIGGGEVVAALQATLQDAEQREATRCAELAEACDRLTNSLAEQDRLRQRAGGLAEASRSTAGATAGRAARAPALAPRRLDVLEAKAAALEEEHRARSRALVAVESQVAEATAQQSFAGSGAIGGSSPVRARSKTGGLLQEVQALERELGQKESLLDRKLDSFSLLRNQAAPLAGATASNPALGTAGGVSALLRLAGRS